jgi:Flp pilus assembly protein TadB
MNEEEWLKALERRIQSPKQPPPPKQAPSPMRPLTDDERYERDTVGILKAEERTDVQQKVLTRLDRMEHRIRRIELLNKQVYGYTKSTFELIAVVIVAVTVLGVTYLVNKEMGNGLFSWLLAAAIMGYIVFVFVREMRRNRKPTASEE